MMVRARTLGFEIVLVYIGTENVEINLTRITHRVMHGGHDVPEADVRRRYGRSFENLPEAAGRANHTVLFDHSTELGYPLVAVLSPAAVHWFEPMPRWAAFFKTTLP